MRVLLATTTFNGKGHCLDRWYNAIKQIQNIDILLVDNSDTPEYAEQLKSKGIPAIHLDLGGDNYSRMAQTCEYIRQYVIENNYDYWLSIESDVLVPSNILEILLEHPSDWTGISYRDRDGLNFCSEFGCSLFSRRLLEQTDFKDVPDNFTHDSWFMSEKFRPINLTKITLYNILDIKHLE